MTLQPAVSNDLENHLKVTSKHLKHLSRDTPGFRTSPGNGRLKTMDTSKQRTPLNNGHLRKTDSLQQRTSNVVPELFSCGKFILYVISRQQTFPKNGHLATVDTSKQRTAPNKGHLRTADTSGKRTRQNNGHTMLS